MSSKKIIAFDFDGVIVDSLKLSYSINKDFLPDLRYEDWCTWSEGNFHEVIKSRDDIKFLSSDEGYDYFKEKYDQEVVNILPVDGIKDVLENMHQYYTMVVVSSNSQESIELYLKQHNFFSYFEDILGEETSRSKVEKFKLILNEYNVNSDEIVLITDSLGDIKEANELKIKSLAVLWGIHDHNTLQIASPHSIISEPKDIIKAVESVWV